MKYITTLALLILSLFAVATASAQITTNEIKFFYHPDIELATPTATVRANLAKYVDDMNTILLKNTGHFLKLTLPTGVQYQNYEPHDGVTPAGGAPRTNYPFWVYIRPSTNGLSTAGTTSVDSSGAAVLTGFRWTKSYNPSVLTNNSAAFQEYRFQLTHLLHEYAHIFGVNVDAGEVSSLVFAKDNITNFPPVRDLVMMTGPLSNVWNYADSYWGAGLGATYVYDPMITTVFPVGTNRATTVAATRFSEHSANIIWNNYRNHGNPTNARPLMATTTHHTQIVDGNTCLPVTGAFVVIFRVGNHTTVSVSGTVTTTNGHSGWSWNPAGGSYTNDPIRLVKVSAPGYISTSVYLTALDLVEWGVMQGNPNFTNTIRLVRPKLKLSIARNHTITVTNIVGYQPFSIQMSTNLDSWWTVTNVNPTTTSNFVFVPPQNLHHQFFRTAEASDCDLIPHFSMMQAPDPEPEAEVEVVAEVAPAPQPVLFNKPKFKIVMPPPLPPMPPMFKKK